MSADKQSCEGLLVRVLWMILFALVWQVAELVLLALALVQLVYRLTSGRPHVGAMNFGDSLSQYLAQIGRFGCFHSDEKPWPFADWPAPREPQGEGAEAVRAAAWCEAAAPAASVAPSATPEQGAATVEPAPPEDSAPASGEAQAEAETKNEAGPDAPAEPKA